MLLGRASVFFKRVAIDKSTKVHRKLAHPRLSGQYKLGLKSFDKRRIQSWMSKERGLGRVGVMWVKIIKTHCTTVKTKTETRSCPLIYIFSTTPMCEAAQRPEQELSRRSHSGCASTTKTKTSLLGFSG